MKEDKQQIELRSEKVRNIIGHEPPFWVRHGISIIALLLLIMGVISYIIFPSFIVMT